MRTFFENFVKDNGLPVCVEYSFRGGSETSYSPRFGADGGDPCDVSIVASWPNTDGFNRLCRLGRIAGGYGWRDRTLRFLFSPLIWLCERRAQLTDVERERMESSIIENHVDEPDDFEEDYR